MTKTQCCRRLRLSRQTVTDVCVLIAEDLTPHSTGHHVLPMAVKVTVALNFFAFGSLQGTAVDLNGISQAAAHHCISLVTDALFDTARKHIHFMREQPRLHRGQWVSVPSLDSPSWLDSFILRQSRLSQIFTPAPKILGWILGDKGNPLKRWLLTLLQEPQRDAQRRYNQCHLISRTTIDQAIRLFKMQFQCLDWSGGALFPEVLPIVVVCCALHNMALHRSMDPEDDEAVEGDSSSEEEEEQDVEDEEVEAMVEDAEHRGTSAAQGGGWARRGSCQDVMNVKDLLI
ncbi:putative nuclease HARBI1 [Heterodontus francisci]|uniref:putative nuclease HARBI1 n=1 Tax=Heterodontus francisci TaxID=7792 RepID=UPI00355B46C8